MQIEWFSILSCFWQFELSSSPLPTFYTFEAFKVCFIFFINPPDSDPFSTFLQAALCRGIQLHQDTCTRLPCPLPAGGYSHCEEGAEDLGVGDQCPVTQEWLCFSKTTVPVCSLPQSYGSHLPVNFLSCRPTGLRAVTAPGVPLQPLLVSLNPAQKDVVPSLNAFQLPHLSTTYIQEKIKVKARECQVLSREDEKLWVL